MARPLNPDIVAAPGRVDDPAPARSRDRHVVPDGPVPRGMKRTRKGTLKRRSLVWRLRKVLLAIVVIGVLAASGGAYAVWSKTELPAAKRRLETSFLCAADVQTNCSRDNAFAEVASAEAGVHVAYNQIPPVFIQALIAAEDKDYFAHKGVDPAGVGRALWLALRSKGAGQQGGSTITQQYIKNVSDDRDLSLKRKVTEAIRAMKIEQERTKEEILEAYLNTIFFGRNAVGLDAAVRAYFGADFHVEQLDLARSAYLVSIIREPNLVDPRRSATDPQREEQERYATKRRKQVLDTMVEMKTITPEQRDQVAKMGWDYVIPRGESKKGAIRKHEKLGAEQWAEYVKSWLKKHTEITEAELEGGGLRVYTTFDPVQQQMAYDAVTETFTEPTFLDTGMASVDSNGFLRMMVGARDPEQQEVNLALGAEGCKGCGRPTGSAFKPIVLAQYLKEGGRLDKVYRYEKKVIDGTTFEKEHNDADGDVTVEEATYRSLNPVFGQMIKETGVADVIDLAGALGIDTSAFAHEVGVAIGTQGVSPVDLAAAYSVFANRGERVGDAKAGPYPVTKVTDAQGNLMWEPSLARVRVLSTDVADQVNYALRQVIENDKGTGHAQAQVAGQAVAGKTGTVADAKTKIDNTDAWFGGFTCKVTTTVWLGFAKTGGPIGKYREYDPARNAAVNGGTIPAELWRRYMAKATAGQPSCPPFDLPPSVTPRATFPPLTFAPRPTVPPTTATTVPEPGPEATTTTTVIPTTTDPAETSTTRRIGPLGRRTTTVPPDPSNPAPSTTVSLLGILGGLGGNGGGGGGGKR